jgi:hypothetical protein
LGCWRSSPFGLLRTRSSNGSPSLLSGTN